MRSLGRASHVRPHDFSIDDWGTPTHGAIYTRILETVDVLVNMHTS